MDQIFKHFKVLRWSSDSPDSLIAHLESVELKIYIEDYQPGTFFQHAEYDVISGKGMLRNKINNQTTLCNFESRVFVEQGGSYCSKCNVGCYNCIDEYKKIEKYIGASNKFEKHDLVESEEGINHGTECSICKIYTSENFCNNCEAELCGECSKNPYCNNICNGCDEIITNDYWSCNKCSNIYCYDCKDETNVCLEHEVRLCIEDQGGIYLNTKSGWPCCCDI